MTTSVLFTDVFVYDADTESAMSGPTDVLVRGNRIHSIGAEARHGADESSEIVAGGGHHILLPGLINGHFHSPANHLKGSLPSLPLEIFMLFESPSDEALAPTPREAYLRTMLAGLEMLRTGTTTVQDDAFFMPSPTRDIVDAVMQAYADCGIRASVALDQPELSERQKLPLIGILADSAFNAHFDAPASTVGAELLELYDYIISRWHLARNGRLTAAVSISAPQRVTPEYFAALNDLSLEHGIPIFAHMLETKVQRVLGTHQPRFHGQSLVGYTAGLGLLSERMNIIHAVWVDDDDLKLIADSGATIAHNPVSNLRLGSGVAPFRRMKDLGIPVALGVDEAICDDSVNMWGVVKMAGLIHNVSGQDSDLWPTAAEVLDALWTGGAHALLQGHQLGVIREGYLADIAMLDLHSAAFTPFNDLRGQLVYCESGTSVRLTMVDGQIVFSEGTIVSVDEAALLDEARELFACKLASVHDARMTAREMVPDYQSIVRAAASLDVGMNRWVGAE